MAFLERMKLENYLDIAEVVLSTARRPMSPRAIMDAAHRARIVPAHLYGKTQHKTLQARLSEDILEHKLESRFFRTEPGLFFLSAFRSDPAIPNNFKDPFHARRRTRDLCKPAALALEKKFLKSQSLERLTWQQLLKLAGRAGALKHVDPRTPDSRFIMVWAFSVVRRDNEILCYRIGRYRDQRAAFANHRSIGFVEMVGFQDVSLFSEDMGVSECGLNAVLTDLDLSRSAFPGEVAKPSVSFAIMALRGAADPVALVVLEWSCPEWFEPTARRLSLNDLRWIDATHKPNNIDDFEPWSAIAFDALVERSAQKYSNGEKNKRTTNSILTI